MYKKTDKDADILKLARERYSMEKDLNSDLRQRQQDDIRFKAGFQWPEAIKSQREQDPYGARPCLVINHARTHANRLANDIRQNRPQIKVLPVDDQADVETAEIYNGLCRHIQVSGDADLAYDCASGFAIDMGEGFFEVVVNELEDGTQEIDIEPIINPHSVHLEPYFENPTGADAKWCFVDDPTLREDLESQYPDVDLTDWEATKSDMTLRDWYIDDTRINAARYYLQEDGVWICYKLIGDQILERWELPGQYLPIIRVLGEENVVDGKKDTKGLIRDIKDPCMMYNYWASANTERIALAPKAPYVIADGALEGHEDEWSKANVSNIPYLSYNSTDSEGNQLPPPDRTPPVSQDTAIIQAMMQAHDDIKAVTGQFDASLGNRSNETSGVAQRERKQESNTTTFHFVDNLSRAIRQCGRVVVDLIPKVMSPEAIVRVLGEDGTPDFAQVAPDGPAYQELQDSAGKVQKIYNLGVGKYDVTVVAGPSFSTRRTEAAVEMKDLMARSPEMMQIAGDLMVKNLDWPGADDIAKRLKLMLPPQIQQQEDQDDPGAAQAEAAVNQMLDQIEPQMQQLQQQAQEAGQAAQQATQENQMMKIESASKDLQIQEMQIALRDKSQELEIKSAEVQVRAQDSENKKQSEQMKIEGDIVQAAMAQKGENSEPKEAKESGTTELANTVAAQASTRAAEQLSKLAEQLAKQAEEIAATVTQTAQANESVSAEVIQLKGYIEDEARKKQKVTSAVLEFMQSDGSDKAMKKTVNAIKKT